MTDKNTDNIEATLRSYEATMRRERVRACCLLAYRIAGIIDTDQPGDPQWESRLADAIRVFYHSVRTLYPNVMGSQGTDPPSEPTAGIVVHLAEPKPGGPLTVCGITAPADGHWVGSHISRITCSRCLREALRLATSTPPAGSVTASGDWVRATPPTYRTSDPDQTVRPEKPINQRQVCLACQAGRHDQCLFQVHSSGIPCECQVCWHLQVMPGETGDPVSAGLPVRGHWTGKARTITNLPRPHTPTERRVHYAVRGATGVCSVPACGSSDLARLTTDRDKVTCSECNEWLGYLRGEAPPVKRTYDKPTDMTYGGGKVQGFVNFPQRVTNPSGLKELVHLADPERGLPLCKTDARGPLVTEDSALVTCIHCLHHALKKPHTVPLESEKQRATMFRHLSEDFTNFLRWWFKDPWSAGGLRVLEFTWTLLKEGRVRYTLECETVKRLPKDQVEL